MNDWRTLTLENAGVKLIDCVHKTPAAAPNGYPYVAIPQMKNGRIDFSDARRISTDDFIEWTKKAKPRVHDVVLSRRTNPGVTATFGENCDFALGQNLVLLRANGKCVLPQFLRWLTISPGWWAQIEKFNNVGAVFDSLRCGDVPKFELLIPPKPDQEAISSVLGALDDKIDLNRRMNETLESMARLIFKDWFFDFGPTRAKMEGRAPYLATDIWSLFPDRIDDDGKPEGWTIGCLGDLIGQRNERATPSEDTRAKPYVPIDCISPRSLTLTETKPGSDAQSSLIKFYKNDILFGAMRPYFHKVCISPFEGTTRTTVFVFHPLKASDFAFTCMLLHSKSTIEYATTHSTGTTIPYATWRHSLENMPVIIPRAEIRQAFNDKIRPMLLRFPQTYFENNSLAAARDLLLPKLMSGEIRVRDAENIMEACA
ncbi:restriction endonuclease subunit S [Rhodoblastus sp. 17X3]|uniref:restriction endonuclease subunit S n=1 Tax=Rhodoblastus sp. 17X3 TaxID=3047026 RepID=UPI0024B66B7D|nr:restriction endonuclease subunit S [Rhodoblastus sp. 17X3]MDI9849983.1 restriction endonuclease subunit S [Rhodoblastus sp. 17X3]